MKLSRMRTSWFCVPTVTTCAPRAPRDVVGELEDALIGGGALRRAGGSRGEEASRHALHEEHRHRERRLPVVSDRRRAGDELVRPRPTRTRRTQPRRHVGRRVRPPTVRQLPAVRAGGRSRQRLIGPVHPLVRDLDQMVDRGLPGQLQQHVVVRLAEHGGLRCAWIESEAAAERARRAFCRLLADPRLGIARRRARVVRPPRFEIGHDEVVQAIAYERPTHAEAVLGAAERGHPRAREVGPDERGPGDRGED